MNIFNDARVQFYKIRKNIVDDCKLNGPETLLSGALAGYALTTVGISTGVGFFATALIVAAIARPILSRLIDRIEGDLNSTQKNRLKSGLTQVVSLGTAFAIYSSVLNPINALALIGARGIVLPFVNYAGLRIRSIAGI